MRVKPGKVPHGLGGIPSRAGSDDPIWLVRLVKAALATACCLLWVQSVWSG